MYPGFDRYTILHAAWLYAVLYSGTPSAHRYETRLARRRFVPAPSFRLETALDAVKVRFGALVVAHHPFTVGMARLTRRYRRAASRRNMALPSEGYAPVSAAYAYTPPDKSTVCDRCGQASDHLRYYSILHLCAVCHPDVYPALP